MTCGSVMTRNPSCCLSGDSVSEAARIMKQQDVGPVLVVSDHTSMQLAGIVTDRDIVVEVVAENREPSSTRVDSIMSTSPVTCTEDEDVMAAVKRMADYQVRRIPVIDQDGCVIGIISQADIARHASEAQVGELVEEISQPWGMGEWPDGKYEDSAKPASAGSGMGTTSALAIGALCLGFGAGLMFMFDPSRGKKRRAQLRTRSNELRDRGNELWNHRNEVYENAKSSLSETGAALSGKATELGEKAQNLVSNTKNKVSRAAESLSTDKPWQGEAVLAGEPTPGSYNR